MINYLKNMRASTRKKCFILLGMAIVFVILQISISTGVLSFQIKNMLVQICYNIILAVSLNLVVGILGELSLGHAGFMCIGAFVGGLFAALLHKSKGMIIGICVGFIMFLIITVVSLIVSGGGITLNTPLRLVIMSILGAVGGIVGVNRSAKRKMI